MILDPKTGLPFADSKADPMKSAAPSTGGRYTPPKFDEFDKKKERQPIASPASILGDVIGGIAGFLTDHNTLMALGYAGAGLCLTLSTFGYQRVFIPLLIPQFGALTGWVSGTLIAALSASFIQYLQIAPRLMKYDPDMADRMAYKLGLKRFVNPKETEDSPSLLPIVKRHARTGHAKSQKEAETASLIAYLFEAVGAFFAFPIIAAGSLNLGALFLAVLAVRGFETAFKFASKQKSLRLTSRESQKYKLLQRMKRQEADQSMK